MNDVETLLKTTLAAQCRNVARLVFTGKADTYITYQLVLWQDRDAADDEPQGTEYTYRIDIYSKKDYISLLRQTKRGLQAAGFYGIVVDPEVYESDTGFFHVPMEAKYYEKLEV